MTSTTTRLSRLEQAAMTETFEDVKLLIYRITHRFARQHGMSFDDLIGQANFCFVRSYHRYKANRKAKLSTWICFVVDRHLRTYVRRQYRHRNHLEVNEEILGAGDPDTFLTEFHSELSEDAQLVVSLLLDAPREMQTRMKWDGALNKTTVKKCLREYLEDIGWCSERIASSFDEIKKALA